MEDNPENRIRDLLSQGRVDEAVRDSADVLARADAALAREHDPEHLAANGGNLLKACYVHCIALEVAGMNAEALACAVMTMCAADIHGLWQIESLASPLARLSAVAAMAELNIAGGLPAGALPDEMVRLMWFTRLLGMHYAALAREEWPVAEALSQAITMLGFDGFAPVFADGPADASRPAPVLMTMLGLCSQMGLIES